MGADNVIRVTARGQGRGMVVEGAGLEGLLPVAVPGGGDGVHVAGGSGSEAFDAHFRAAAARLLASGETLPPGVLGVPGRVVATSYPGDVWRYTVDAAGQRFIIDDAREYAQGSAVRIAVPAPSLHLFPA